MDVFEGILNGINEAIEYERGDKTKARSIKVQIDPLPEYSSEDIKVIRKNLGLTQFLFASLFGVSTKTVEAWECGTNSPSGPAARMLSVLQKDPSFANQFIMRS